jgi:RNA-directed DNA polymerase
LDNLYSLTQDSFYNISLKFRIPPIDLLGLYNNIHAQYTLFLIPKKDGSTRTIANPSDELKRVQRLILKNILEPLHVSDCSCGFKKGSSTVDNAARHVKKECILSLDVENFFPSILYEQVYKTLLAFGISRLDSHIISQFCTYNGSLPQGAPTSPCLSNLVCFDMDKQLCSFANKINAQYSRYADDITFSGGAEIAKELNNVINIVSSYKFKINDRKTRIHYKDKIQVVTGIIVNKKMQVPNKMKRRLRQHIYYCKKYGVKEHVKRIKYSGKSFKNHILGLCAYIKMVEPDLGRLFYEEISKIDWTPLDHM